MAVRCGVRGTLFLLLLLMNGCATVVLDLTSQSAPIAMTGMPEPPATVVNTFTIERKAYFTLAGFVKVSNPDFTGAMDSIRRSVQGDAVTNVRIEVRYDLWDTVLPYGIGAAGWALFGPVGMNAMYLMTMQTYRLRGEVVRYAR